MPGGLRVVRELFEAVAEHRVQIGEEQQRNFGTLADLRGDVEDLRERGAGGEGAVAGLLDDGAIGDGIGERHAQFDEIGAAAFERFDESGAWLRAWDRPP